MNCPSEGQTKYTDALFFISIYSGLKCCPSVLDISGVRDFPRKFKNSSLLTAAFKNSPSAQYVSAANHVWENVDILRKPIASLKQILYWYVPFLCQIIFVLSRLKSFNIYIFILPFLSYCFCFVCLVLCFCVFVLFCVLCVSLCWLYNRQLRC